MHLSHPHGMKIQEMLRIPIQRGDDHGIVGNGQMVLLAWKMYQRMKHEKSTITEEMWTQLDRAYDSLRLEIAGEKIYYECPTCSSKGKCSFL